MSDYKRDPAVPLYRAKWASRIREIESRAEGGEPVHQPPATPKGGAAVWGAESAETSRNDPSTSKGADGEPLLDGLPLSVRVSAARKAGCFYCARTRGHDPGCRLGEALRKTEEVED